MKGESKINIMNKKWNEEGRICITLMDKKCMLKNYTGKKILQIMEKTTVDFVSLASSIYHCFFSLDLPLVMLDVDPVSP